MDRIKEIYCKKWVDSLPATAEDEQSRVAAETLRRYLVNHLTLDGIDFAKLAIVVCTADNEIIAMRPFTHELFSTIYTEWAELVPDDASGATRYLLQIIQ